jgi:hypothetical protein
MRVPPTGLEMHSRAWNWSTWGMAESWSRVRLSALDPARERRQLEPEIRGGPKRSLETT